MSAQASLGAPAKPALEPSSPSTALNNLAQTERTRAKLIEELIAQGVDASRASRVAEASIRRHRARQDREVFRYADMEEQFEALCRGTGAGARRIELAKQRVWVAAMGIVDEHGCAIEEALFFCYSESIYLHGALLASVGTADATTGIAPH
jgi:hypothetical protein